MKSSYFDISTIAKILLSATFIILFAFSVFADTLVLTALKISDVEDFSIELNNVFILNKLKTETSGKDKILSVPFRSKNGYKTNYYSFLDRKFNISLAEDIVEDRVSDIPDTEITYQINNFKIIKNSPKLRAVTSVIFNGILEVNVLIFEGEYGLWVSWPSEELPGGIWRKIFEIKDKELKKRIDKDILDTYLSKAQKK